jgi:hypothetical protein
MTLGSTPTFEYGFRCKLDSFHIYLYTLYGMSVNL